MNENIKKMLQVVWPNIPIFSETDKWRRQLIINRVTQFMLTIRLNTVDEEHNKYINGIVDKMTEAALKVLYDEIQTNSEISQTLIDKR